MQNIAPHRQAGRDDAAIARSRIHEIRDQRVVTTLLTSANGLSAGPTELRLSLLEHAVDNTACYKKRPARAAFWRVAPPRHQS